ncbi:hypothetical protein M378DRAFT_80722, partial [Amanita muscaria Koide BX008]
MSVSSNLLDLPDPQCHAMQELSIASTERAIVRELLVRQAQGDDDAKKRIAAEPLYQHLSFGLAYTTGSALGCVPPSTDACLEAFLVPNKVGLTAGARAWTKHFHRSIPAEHDEGSDAGMSKSKAKSAMRRKAELEARAGWWGVASGPREVVNEKALA